MAGKFEAPKGGKGYVPKRTNARPGDEIQSGRTAPERKPRQSDGAPSRADGNPRPQKMPPLRPETAGSSARRPAPARKAPPSGRRPKKKKKSILPILLTLLVLILAAGLVFAGIKIFSAIKRENNRPTTQPTQGVVIDLPTSRTEATTEEPTEPETTLPEPEHVVATASVGTIGDLLMHSGLLNGGRSDADGTYDFSYMFRFLAPYAQARDYAVANLETTFGGKDFPYQGNPSFNCPDALAQNALDAGFDMFLTANNHCYDTLMTGIKRSLEVSRGVGLKTLGTRLTEDEPRFEIVDVNGIRIGMVCYTYTMSIAGSGRPNLNGNTPVENPALVNWFYNAKLDAFYAEVQGLLDQMREQGAETIMFFIHWGEEYKIAENSTQDAIAQKLCDLGVDVIVGGHPHVIEPVSLLTSTADSNHKTVCIYSLGNAVSNQRIAEMRLKTGHTEDGCMFTVTFEKYSDGTVYLASAEVLPTWVNMRIEGGKRRYDILPLDNETRSTWRDTFGLDDTLFENAVNSYGRTMDLVGGGLKVCNEYLQAQKQAREQYYYDLAMGTLEDAA